MAIISAPVMSPAPEHIDTMKADGVSGGDLKPSIIQKRPLLTTHMSTSSSSANFLGSIFL